VYLDPALARRDYQRKLAAHNEALEKLCAGLASDSNVWPPIFRWKAPCLIFLRGRMQRGKTARNTRS